MLFEINKERVKTPMEMEDAFQKIPLTDSQKGTNRKILHKKK